MYGLTECKRVSYLEPELVDEKPTSVGRAIPGTEALVLREDMTPVEPGETGCSRARAARDGGLLAQARADRGHARRTARSPGRADALHARPLHGRRGRLPLLRRAHRRHHQDARREGQPDRGRERALRHRGRQEAPWSASRTTSSARRSEPTSSSTTGATLGEQEMIGACRMRLENFMVPREVEFLDELPDDRHRQGPTQEPQGSGRGLDPGVGGGCGSRTGTRRRRFGRTPLRGLRGSMVRRDRSCRGPSRPLRALLLVRPGCPTGNACPRSAPLRPTRRG